MEILQKLTLYDLLGYALPGGALLMVYGQENLDVLFDEGAKGWILLLLFGFLVGVAISEIMQWVERGLLKVRGKKQWLKLCEEYSLTAERMGQALKNARMIKVPETDANNISLENCRDYQAAVYADIQTDPKYSRIHNYASAALLYKNMVFVAVAAVVFFAWPAAEQMDMMEKILKILFAILGGVCFFSRWMRFKKKKVGYALCWFVDKYCGETK